MGEAPTYCSACGGPLEDEHLDGRQRRYCPECGSVHYRNPKPCAGTVVVDGDRVLLIRRTEPPAAGSWSLPAGYLERDEPPRAAAVRELREETALRVPESELRLLDTAFVQRPDGQHVLVLIYVATLEAADGVVTAGDDVDDARFWTLPELRESGERIEPGYEEVLESATRAVTESSGPRSA